MEPIQLEHGVTVVHDPEMPSGHVYALSLESWEMVADPEGMIRLADGSLLHARYLEPIGYYWLPELHQWVNSEPSTC